MNIKARQSGVTMWGMLVIALLVVFFALLLFMLIPPYLDDLKVKTALDSVERQAQGSAMSNPEIMEALRKEDGVITRAAQLLGLQRTTLAEKMKKLGIS